MGRINIRIIGKVQRRQGQNIDTVSPIIVLSKAVSQKVCAFPSKRSACKAIVTPTGFLS